VKAEPDRLFGAGWLALGAVVLAASWRMDRLESQHINPWSAPGLLPGLLGALMLLFGAALLLRRFVPASGDAERVAPAGRTWLAIALCVGFAAGLLGHGLPFWVTAAAFMFVAILAFRWLDREAGAGLGRLALESAVIALCASAAISLLFQEVFLIRLP
jgi:hypothetical protein